MAGRHEPRWTRVSKRLAYVLRHAPERIGVRLDEGGWVEVDVLLDALARSGLRLTRAELEELVARDEKGRYALAGGRIRAQQGHSVPVDLGLVPLAPPEWLYHGTAAAALSSILAEGLRRGRRHHVHLSPDPATATRVGARHGRPVVLEVDAASMYAGGHRFYRSGNGVWLADAVPARYLRRLP